MYTDASADHTGPSPELLVSFCNVAAHPRPTSLYRIDLGSLELRPVDVGLSDVLVVTGSGICVFGERVFHLSVSLPDMASTRTTLSVLDRVSLEVVSVQALDAVLDGHSLVCDGERLLIASTGSDEIISYHLDDDRAVDPQVFWTPTSSGEDSHHVNSVATAGPDVVCSAFGPKSDAEPWSTADSGYIYNVTRDEVLVAGLRQPHSVILCAGELYYCNSQLGTVENQTGVAARLAGYSRGLCAAPDGTLFAATSMSRRPTKAPLEDDGSIFGNPASEGVVEGRVALVVLGAAGLPRTEIGMAAGGAEVYDLLVIDRELSRRA